MLVNLFWLLTVVAVITAMVFMIPPLLVALRSNNPNSLRSPRFISFSCILVVVFCSLAYAIYSKIGSGSQLRQYYSALQIAERSNYKQIRPLYARLQRELLKVELNQAVDLANVELIMYFANIHARLADGILPAEIVKLLRNVIQSRPTQVTALNLLAVNAYKTGSYNEAITYWNAILQLIPTKMHQSKEFALLHSKIATAREFVSTQTNKK
jgi:tetratricopeptide (TPR) repeat protein